MNSVDEGRKKIPVGVSSEYASVYKSGCFVMRNGDPFLLYYETLRGSEFIIS